jgi:gliding motility-associated protein GldM
MSGAKETPRQKMIGMMYLVLTAMLALNVDATVMERFELINGTLERQLTANVIKNGGTVKSIAATVNEKGNRKDDVVVLNRAKDVRAKTDAVISYVDKLKSEIIKLTGGMEDGRLVGTKDMEKMANYMIVKKHGDSLRNRLDAYTTWLSSAFKKDYPSVALDGKEDPYWSKFENQRNKNFSELMFELVPTSAGLASMTQLENDILAYEADALGILGNSIGAKDIAFEGIRPMLLPESQVVAAGTKYKAKMFVTANAVGATPTMSYNGVNVPVDAEGVGKFEFTAKANKYDKNGQQKKTINAVIKLEGETYNAKFDYIVAKPVIQIESASVQALYRNCGNKLNVRVPALGAAYSPTFKAKGGSTVGGKGGRVTVIPISPNLELSVYSGGVFIGTEKFRVKSIPKPELVLKSGSATIDLRNGVKNVPRSMSLIAVPDADFAQFLPADAQYRVTKWEVTLARGSRPIEVKKVNGTKANLASFVSKARAGDRIIVEAKEVMRMNFKKQKETVKIGVNASIKTIPINK